MSEHIYAMSERSEPSMENHLYALLSRIEDKLTALAHSTSELVGTQHATATALNRLTYELLQEILLMLPMMEDVVLAQRVNKPFRSTITNSLPLQQKLFSPARTSTNQPSPTEAVGAAPASVVLLPPD
ncbi:hypothetical protein LTR17_026989 [Elasticomyces elasticus]|nr:hypothetical protein LTR17_026989 [Elasticomyces elasticus]